MSKRRAAYQDAIVIPSTGTRIPIPEGATEDEIDELVLTHPEVLARAERMRQRRERGEPGIPADEVDRLLEAESAAGAPRPRGRPPGTSKAGGSKGRILVRVPISVHRELAARAQAEGTTINQLILHYISRGLGTDAAPR